MDKQKHTAEPWPRVQLKHKDLDYIEIKRDDYIRAEICVNALAGIEDAEGFMRSVRNLMETDKTLAEHRILRMEVTQALSLSARGKS